MSVSNSFDGPNYDALSAWIGSVVVERQVPRDVDVGLEISVSGQPNSLSQVNVVVVKFQRDMSRLLQIVMPLASLSIPLDSQLVFAPSQNRIVIVDPLLNPSAVSNTLVSVRLVVESGLLSVSGAAAENVVNPARLAGRSVWQMSQIQYDPIFFRDILELKGELSDVNAALSTMVYTQLSNSIRDATSFPLTVTAKRISSSVGANLNEAKSLLTIVLTCPVNQPAPSLVSANLNSDLKTVQVSFDAPLHWNASAGCPFVPVAPLSTLFGDGYRCTSKDDGLAIIIWLGADPQLVPGSQLTGAKCRETLRQFAARGERECHRWR